MLVTDIYHRRCAVTQERTLPALEAAHIRPYGEGGEHEPRNGLLLRRDIHSLFDAGYVTVTPSLHFEVGALGKSYPALWSRSFAKEGRTGDQQDAFCIAAWLSGADRNGSLAALLKPDLTPNEREVAQVEGLILGVPGLSTRFEYKGSRAMHDIEIDVPRMTECCDTAIRQLSEVNPPRPPLGQQVSW